MFMMTTGILPEVGRCLSRRCPGLFHYWMLPTLCRVVEASIDCIRHGEIIFTITMYTHVYVWLMNASPNSYWMDFSVEEQLEQNFGHIFVHYFMNFIFIVFVTSHPNHELNQRYRQWTEAKLAKLAAYNKASLNCYLHNRYLTTGQALYDSQSFGNCLEINDIITSFLRPKVNKTPKITNAPARFMIGVLCEICLGSILLSLTLLLSKVVKCLLFTKRHGYSILLLHATITLLGNMYLIYQYAHQHHHL